MNPLRIPLPHQGLDLQGKCYQKGRPGVIQLFEKKIMRIVIDSIPAPCTFWDGGGNAVFCNQEAALLFGLENPQECPDRIAEIFPLYQPCGALSTEKIKDYANEALNRGRSQFDWMHQKTDGTPIPSVVTLTRVNWQDEHGLVGFIQDSREKIADDEMRKAYQSRLQLFIDNMPMGCSLRNKDFEILDCNQAVLDLFDVANKEEYSARWRDLVPEYQPDGTRSSDLLQRCMKEALEAGQVRLEWMLQKRDGTLIPAESTIIRVKWQGEDGMVVFVRDLTDIHKYREMERTVQQRLHAMLDSSPLVCGLYDEGCNVLEINHKVEVLFEIPDKQIFIDNFHSFSPRYQPDGALSYEKCFNMLQLAFKKGSARYEWMYQTLNGTPIPCEEVLERVRLGDRDFVIAYIRDLREQKEMLVRLEAALKRAQAGSLAKSRFLSNMSHEIRTPINAIVGMTSIGKSAGDLSGKDYAFEKIEEASSHLLGIINDILEMSKIEAGKFVLHCQPFEFRKLIEHTTAMLSLSIEEKNLKLAVTLDEAIPQFIIGDELRLAQVISNILANAVKFTPSNGQITVSAKRLSSNGDFENALCIEITDTGIGISKEQQARLFSAFEQAEAGITRKFGGTGLGLAISKRIVEAMGGQIVIESDLGKGATFIVTARFEPADSGFHIPGGAEKGQPESFKGSRLLVVDDVEINREIITALLEPTGIGIDCAVNGLEAVNLFRGDPKRYDVILMDVQMPVMDGLSATQRIRTFKDEWAKHIPIIAMTANVFKEDIDLCIQAGMNDHLGKPLQVGRIMEKLRRYLPGPGAGKDR